MKVAAAGGEPAPATAVDAANGDASHVFPTFLPDGRRFLYVSRPSRTVWLGTLDSSESRRLFSSDSQVLYSDGYLLFARQGTLLAQSFEASTATLAGDPIAIAERLAVDSLLGAPAFSSSETGVLVYRTGTGSPETQLTWVDRSGREIGKVGPVGAYRNPMLSGDGTRVALEVLDIENRTQDLWILDLASGAPSRFTTDRGNDIYPVWSPNDSRIAFGSDRNGGIYNLYQKMLSGAAGEEVLLESTGDNLTGPYDWSPDGKFLLFRDLSPEASVVNNGILPLFGDQQISNLFPPSTATQTMSQISPDGRWVAYNSSETGSQEVYLARFPNPSGKLPVSGGGGGGYARWRGDSRELFYYASDGRIMAVPIAATTTSPAIGTPAPLFHARLLGGPVLVTGFRPQYDVRADGERFLLNVPVDEEVSSPAITVVLNWAAGLRR
jgi:hypothetical protein